MATHANPIETTNSIAFTTDVTADACALAAFTLIGTGMLTFAAAALSRGHRAWAGVLLPGWLVWTAASTGSQTRARLHADAGGRLEGGHRGQPRHVPDLPGLPG
jgi:hypothetical protein